MIAGEGYCDDGQDAFAHEVGGRNEFDIDRQCTCGDGSSILSQDGDTGSIRVKEESLWFFLVSGRPIGQPAWYDPIVMNAQKELEVAFDQ